MKRLFLLLSFITFAGVITSFAQNQDTLRATTLADYKVKPYNEDIDAMVQIDEAVAQAKAEGKRVICQVGGNWCIWCLRFNDFITKDEEIDKVIKDNFVYIHVNNSPKNRNTKAIERLGNQKLGYPHLVVLDAEGKIQSVHETGSLEENKSYSHEKVLNFFKTLAENK